LHRLIIYHKVFLILLLRENTTHQLYPIDLITNAVSLVVGDGGGAVFSMFQLTHIFRQRKPGYQSSMVFSTALSHAPTIVLSGHFLLPQIKLYFLIVLFL
jgi:hypothetical protein